MLGGFEDDYIIFDCPGQIELYTHIPVMKQLVAHVQQQDYRVAAVYLLDAQFLDDPGKFFSGVLSALSTMMTLEVPHINVLTKMDLVTDKHRKAELYEQLCFFGWIIQHAMCVCARARTCVLGKNREVAGAVVVLCLT